jgi:hypothetical protein
MNDDIRTLGSLLESRIFLGTAPFGQQIHCQRNKTPTQTFLAM